MKEKPLIFMNSHLAVSFSHLNVSLISFQLFSVRKWTFKQVFYEILALKQIGIKSSCI
jgi:hypothetical protein